MINTLTKSKLGGKGLFQLMCPWHSPSWREGRAGTQSKKLDTGDKIKAMEEHCLMAAPHGLLSRFYNTGPMGGTIHKGLGPPASVIDQANDLQSSLQAYLVGHFFFLNWGSPFPNDARLCWPKPNQEHSQHNALHALLNLGFHPSP